jgi:hypothetical protein
VENGSTNPGKIFPTAQNRGVLCAGLILHASGMRLQVGAAVGFVRFGEKSPALRKMLK